jgi:hypothetical protein
MGTLDTIIDRLHEYLKKQGLPLFTARPANVIQLYELALRSVWEIPDKERREAVAGEITVFLKKYIGGKKMEELFSQITQKLDAQHASRQIQEEKTVGEKHANTPGYVPSFEELFPEDKGR